VFLPDRFYEEVRRALALPEVVVLGHSFGAATALTYAARYPQSTASCVAVAAFGIGPGAGARDGSDAAARAETLPGSSCSRAAVHTSIEAPREYRQAVIGFLRR
jgi:pimeloyl-ACP methyl ester carboxylesterase